MSDLRKIFDWLVDGAPGALSSPEVIDRLCSDIVAAGVPLDRFAAFVRTLHPAFMGRGFYWTPDAPCKVDEAPHAMLESKEFLASPVNRVFETGKPLRRRLCDPDCPRDFPLLEKFRNDGLTDYLVGPMVFLSGHVHAVTFATRSPAGFSDDHVAALLELLRPLSRLAEILALRRTAVNLLSTYVGRHAGENVLSGKIKRGDTESIRAVIWFSDLRGFTQLANTIEPSALVSVLNDLFDCQVPAIERHGGEVLKFMGDGLLAIFPIVDSTRTPGELCDAALDAAVEAFESLSKLNRTRASCGAAPIRFGLALHVGNVDYGNIGGATRLDFTCIGPAVNLASRLEGLTSRLNRTIVVSREFAQMATRPSVPIGSFELKGVPEPQEVFVPEESSPISLG
ncbi:MAG: adenylate/guanylate cyclase domain-containing protein [Deltaproteobacteria bacterium]|nr:adenylate/guanylate cyclase domain-containing protein [Deltaproteobacteria bacterium]